MKIQNLKLKTIFLSVSFCFLAIIGSAQVEAAQERVQPGEGTGGGTPAPTLAVQIVGNTCIREGATLTAINPNVLNWNYYNNPAFLIQWFKNNELIQGANTNTLACVCDGTYAVIVTQLSDGQFGNDTEEGPGCRSSEINNQF